MLASTPHRHRRRHTRLLTRRALLLLLPLQVVCVRGRELFESKSVADAEAFVERLLRQTLDYPLRVLRYRGGRRPREQDGLLAKAAEEAAAAAADAASGATGGAGDARMQ